MENKETSGIRRIILAAGYSMKGFKGAWRREAAFRQELFLTIILGPLGWWLGETFTQKALLILSLMLVLIVELINSAIESVIDRIGPERHPLSGHAKDLGSAAVFISLCGVVLVWSLVAVDVL